MERCRLERGEEPCRDLPVAAARSDWASSACPATPRRDRRGTSAASVSRTPRPARSSSRTPASRSSTASCWDTAEGVKRSASATAAMVPRAVAQEPQSVEVEQLASNSNESPLRTLVAPYAAGCSIRCMPGSGTLFCLASAAAFGAMGVVGKLAYGEGATVGTSSASASSSLADWLILACTGRLREVRLSRDATSASRSRSAPSATARRQAQPSPRSTASTRRSSAPALRVPRPRHRRGDRHGPGVGEPANDRGARPRVDRALPRARGRRCGGRGRARSAARDRRRVRLQRLHPQLGKASPSASSPSC